MTAFRADPFGRGGDGVSIGHVDLKRDRAGADLLCSSFAALQIARSEVHRHAVGDEFFCDLKADSLIGAGNQGDACVTHGKSSLVIDHGSIGLIRRGQSFAT